MEEVQTFSPKTCQPFWQNKFFTLPVLVFFGFVIFLRLQIQHGDEFLMLNDWRTEPFNSLFQFATILGEAWMFFVAGILLLFIHPRWTILVAAIGLLTLPISFYSKDKIGRDRPVTFFEKKGDWEKIAIVPGVKLMSGQTSFPSGHTMAAFGLYSLLASFLPKKNERWAMAFAFLAFAVAFSRVFLVQHFVVDILGGAVFGLAISYLVLILDSFFQKFQFKNR